MRLFIALPLPERVRAALGALQGALAASRADVKWVEPENLHFTLKFLGELPDAQVPAIADTVTQVARQVRPFSLGLGGLGGFPSAAAPRVIWVAAADGRDALAKMAARLEAAGGELAWPREARPFSAHLTIGRVRSPRGRSALVQAMREAAWRPPPAWDADRVQLYQSRLSAAGPRYASLADVRLAG